MKAKISTILTIATVMIMTSGCALIFKGQSAEVRVNSTPDGASVVVNGASMGTTPVTLSLSRNKDHVLVFKKDGYEDVQVNVTKKFDVGTTVVGNVFSWGIFGLIVDIATGAAYSLEPADIEANLPALQAAGIVNQVQKKEDGIQVFMLSKEQWEEIRGSK